MSETQDIKTKIVEAVLALSAEHGWGQFGFIEVAEATGIALADLYVVFDGLDDVLVAYGRQIDAQVVEAAGVMGVHESCRDRLFDVLMERFEVLNTNRAGLLSILKSFEGDPKQAVIALPHLGKSMTAMLELSGFETGGVRGAIRVAGLSGLYIKVLYVWVRDDSADLARVMAALDKDLGRAESVLNFLSL